MIFIKKNTEPKSLTKWKKRNPGKKYAELPSINRRKLRNALLEEQGFVCCFCGTGLGKIEGEKIVQSRVVKKTEHNVRNAHIIPQSKDRLLTLDYRNLCASCNSSLHEAEWHCDIAQCDECLPISPLQPDCLSFFSFSVDGTIVPNPGKSPELQAQADETIKILNLKSNILNSLRSSMLKIAEECLRSNPEYLSNLSQKDADGHFAPFYFVPLSYFQFYAIN